MYGTIWRAKIDPGNKDKLSEVMAGQDYSSVEGYMDGGLLFADEADDEVWGWAVFESRAAYLANADDPAQHERYTDFRSLLASDPEWHDGEITKV